MEEILIVEDERDIREILSFNLERAGYKTIEASTAEQGLEKLNQSTSLILLDVMLPGMSGYEMASKVREGGSHVPIIFLTARSAEEDVLNGFSSGGDDYIAKPFSRAELLARVKAVLKRTSPPMPTKYECGPLVIDIESSTALLDGKEVLFSRKEFDILAFLIKNQGSYYSRSDLIRQLWVDAPYVIDRTIDVHIAHIRTKLGPYKDLLVSRNGFGYSLISC